MKETLKESIDKYDDYEQYLRNEYNINVDGKIPDEILEEVKNLENQYYIGDETLFIVYKALLTYYLRDLILNIYISPGESHEITLQDLIENLTEDDKLLNEHRLENINNLIKDYCEKGGDLNSIEEILSQIEINNL